MKKLHKLAQLIYDDVSDVVDAIDFSELHKRTVLITGATGLIGTYLVASLKKLSDKGKIKPFVIAVVHTAPDSYFKDLLPKNAKIIKGDLSETRFLEKLPNADYIIHAAGYGQPGRFLDNPIKTLKLNTFATFALLEKLKPKGKFFFISTSEVYSGSTKVPYTEDTIGSTNTTHKRGCYIEGKRSGEAISMAYKMKGLDVKTARASLIYGPGTKKDDQRVLNSFIAKALGGKIDMLDAGTAKRTYCYITDAIEIFWKILFSGKEFVYNVGGESKITIADLGKKIGDYVKIPVKIPKVYHGLRDAPDDVWLDLTKIKKEFGKTIFVNLDTGLKKTIEWQKALYLK
ncbi:MAG TPA: NAD-dependent epimerase/dehydratase family protein [Candidatus Paceibacterota bacterium]